MEKRLKKVMLDMPIIRKCVKHILKDGDLAAYSCITAVKCINKKYIIECDFTGAYKTTWYLYLKLTSGCNKYLENIVNIIINEHDFQLEIDEDNIDKLYAYIRMLGE